VNWHFLPGAVVKYTGVFDGGIFDTGENGTDAAVRSVITGAGEFIAANDEGYVINSHAAGSKLHVEGLRMFSDTVPCIRSGDSGGSLHVRVKESIVSSAGDAISIQGDSTQNFIEADSIYSSNAAIVVTAGGGTIKARRIYASGDPAVQITAGELVIHADEIVAQTNHAVFFDASAGVLTIIGARIETLWNNASARAVMNEAGGIDNLKLINCVLLVPSAATYSLDGTGSAVRVLCLPAFMANKARNTTTTALPTNCISIVQTII
jgi:hypothetical protein